MPGRGRAADAEREIIRRCQSGLDVAGLQRELLRALRLLVPVDAAFFATADPGTLLLTGGYAETPLDAATALFLDNEFDGGDVNRFASLATSARHVATLDEATRGDRLSSERSRDIMRPLGLGDELRAALVAGSECWGYLCLHRDDRRLGFTASEAALVARLGPHIAHGLRQATLLHGTGTAMEGSTPGVVLLADDRSALAITPEAEHLLSLIPGGPAPHLPLPVAVYTVAAALLAVENGTAPPGVLPSVRVRAEDGRWLRLHASRLQGPPGEHRIAAVVELADGLDTLPLMLSAHRLTPREVEVARLVLRGAPTSVIADTLHLSRHTVQDHLKAVFDKVGVRTRRELVGVLLATGRSDPN